MYYILVIDEELHTCRRINLTANTRKQAIRLRMSVHHQLIVTNEIHDKIKIKIVKNP